MQEYTIEIQRGDSKPYTLYTYSSFDLCYNALLQMINTNTVKKEYYVINDFYKNEYVPFLKHITKYTIKVRDVTEWEIYSQDVYSEKRKNNIIKLF